MAVAATAVVPSIHQAAAAAASSTIPRIRQAGAAAQVHQDQARAGLHEQVPPAAMVAGVVVSSVHQDHAAAVVPRVYQDQAATGVPRVHQEAACKITGIPLGMVILTDMKIFPR